MVPTVAALLEPTTRPAGPVAVTPGPSQVAYVVESRDRRMLPAQSIAPVIRQALVGMLESIWTDAAELAAIDYLKGTAAPLAEKVAP